MQQQDHFYIELKWLNELNRLNVLKKNTTTTQDKETDLVNSSLEIEETTMLHTELINQKMKKDTDNLSGFLDQQYKDTTYYFNQFQLNDFIYKKEKQTEGKLDSQSHQNNILFSKIIENADYYTIAWRLKYLCVKQNNGSLKMESNSLPAYQEHWENHLIKHLETHIEKYIHIPIIKYYYHLFMFQKQPTEEKAILLLNLLNEALYKNLFGKDEIRQIFTPIVRFYNYKILIGGDVSYWEKLLALYKMMEKHRIIYDEQNFISPPQHFFNFIKVAIYNNEFEYAKSFYIENKKNLKPETENRLIENSKALILFAEKKYQSVLKTIDKDMVYKTDNFYFYKDRQIILIKTLYEMPDIDSAKNVHKLENAIKNFYERLEREEKFNQKLKQTYLNFISFIKKLIKVNPYDEKGLNNLFNKIKNQKTVSEKKWLLEKTHEILSIGQTK